MRLSYTDRHAQWFPRLGIYIDRSTIGVLSSAINFSRFLCAHFPHKVSHRSSNYSERRKGKKKKKICGYKGSESLSHAGREIRDTRGSRNFEKSISLFHAFRVSRLRRRCIAHYLMDGFSLCSADSLTAGPPDCTLRPFSGCTGEPWLVVPEGGTQEREGSEGGRRRGDEVEWKRVARARGDVQSRRCIMNRTPAPPGPRSAFTETPLVSP